jgi:hypothetical protein
MVVGIATFHRSAQASDATSSAAVSAAPNGQAVTSTPIDGSPSGGPDEAASAEDYDVDGLEAVDSEPDPDPDPDNERARPIDVVAPHQATLRDSPASKPTILGPVAREDSPTAAIVAARPARGPPTR